MIKWSKQYIKKKEKKEERNDYKIKTGKLCIENIRSIISINYILSIKSKEKYILKMKIEKLYKIYHHQTEI